jgi:hypothetical protein
LIRDAQVRVRLRGAEEKAYLNRMLSARLDCGELSSSELEWQQEKEQIQKIRCVGFWPGGRFAASLDLESRRRGG